MTAGDPPRRSTAAALRRVVVAVIIVSFGLAALGGIIVLLGGSLGPEAGRVLGTTAVVGAFSVGVLCCAALVGRRLQWFGLVGAVVNVIAAALVVWIIWYQGDYGYGSIWEPLSQAALTGAILSAACALASLLMLLADRRRAVVRIGLIATLALLAIVAALTIYPIWATRSMPDDLYWRITGIVGILAALGGVVVPVASLLLRDRAVDRLSDDARERIETEAARRGVTADALVAILLGDPAPAAAAEPPFSGQVERRYAERTPVGDDGP